MEQLLISGTIGRDAELRQAGDTSVAGFSVVVDKGKDQNGQKRPGVWYDCSLWDKRGVALAPYLTKGTKVTIVGLPTARSHNEKAYLGCTVREIDLQGSSGKQNASTAAPAAPYQAPRASDQVSDDEIPF